MWWNTNEFYTILLKQISHWALRHCHRVKGQFGEIITCVLCVAKEGKYNSNRGWWLTLQMTGFPPLLDLRSPKTLIPESHFPFAVSCQYCLSPCYDIWGSYLLTSFICPYFVAVVCLLCFLEVATKLCFSL